MVAVYSFPGLGWLGITGGLWVLARAGPRPDRGRPRRRLGAGRAAPLPIAGPAIGVLVLRRPDPASEGDRLPHVGRRRERRRNRQQAPLRGLAASRRLGIWPSGNWLLGTTDLSSAWIFAVDRHGRRWPSAWSGGCAGGTSRCPRRWSRRSPIYAYSTAVRDGGLYVQAKALVVPASLVMLLVLVALFSPGRAAGSSGASPSSSSPSPPTRRSSPCATPSSRPTTASTSWPSSATRSRASGSCR